MGNLIDFKNSLSEVLKGAIPAEQAHQKIMKHRLPVRELESKIKQARKAAVLLLLYPKNGKLYTVFTLRAEYEGVHSRQISLPGGSVEKVDKTLVDTALREANEEIALEINQVEIVGSLSPLYVPPSNFIIQPYIGIQYQACHFIPDPIEVASIIEFPVEDLIGDDKIINKEIDVRGNNLFVKGYELGSYFMWGATAMIVKEFTEIMPKLQYPTI